MSESLPNNASRSTPASSANLQQFPSGRSAARGEIDRNQLLSGSFNDQYMVREVIAAAMKSSGKSRAQLADEISFLVGTVVTERQLNAFAAESREDCKFPVQYARALAEVTGCTRVLTCFIEKAGLVVITPAEKLILELGRQVLEKERAEAEIANLKQQLQEGSR
jgi:hypothetical protein